MAYSYDYFVSALKCPVCGTVSPVDDSTEMYTYIREQSNAEYLGVGSPLHIAVEEIEHNTCDGYLKIKTPKPGEPIRLLNPWHCPTCGTYNWAEIVVRDDVIAEISSVPLDRETLDRAHLISNEARFVAESLLGLSAEEFMGRDVVQVLREKL
jgi:hypothetical protein